MVPVDLKAIDVLLFDLGNVVIEIDFDRALERWAADAGSSSAALHARFAFDAAYRRHERGELDAAGYFAALRRRLGVDLDDETLAAGWNDIYVGAIPEVVAALPRLARQRRLVGFTNTNAMHHGVWSRRYAAELAAFERIYLSCTLGRRKPEAAAFAAVVADLGVAPQRILFFDDDAANVRGACAVGMPAVRVRGPADVLAAVAPLA